MVGQLYPGCGDASHWEWIGCGRVHSVQVFRSDVALGPCITWGFRWTRAPGAIISKCEVEVIVIKLDIGL